MFLLALVVLATSISNTIVGVDSLRHINQDTMVNFAFCADFIVNGVYLYFLVITIFHNYMVIVFVEISISWCLYVGIFLYFKKCFWLQPGSNIFILLIINYASTLADNLRFFEWFLNRSYENTIQ